MNDDSEMLRESFGRLLSDVCALPAVRAAHEVGETEAIWSTLVESGFLDALVPEENGGAGLTALDLAPLVIEAGHYLLPVAFGHTAVARALVARAGLELPVDGPIVLWELTHDGRPRSVVTPMAVEGGHALVQQDNQFHLAPLVAAGQDGFHFTIAAPDKAAPPLIAFELDACSLFDWGAGLTALASAGATTRVLDMLLQHVTERQQFGRPLGNFQAIQHMAAQAAEQSVLARTAALMALSGAKGQVDPLRVAVAKSVTAFAAAEVARVAHAVHGAIGISEEHDLQLFTRQLKRWELSHGSQAYWAKMLGEARLAYAGGTSVDFVRARLAPLAS